MMKHICKICDYEAEQPTHHKDHLKSNIHIMTFAKRLLENRYKYSLQSLCSTYHIDQINAHRALPDVFALEKVYNILCNNLSKQTNQESINNNPEYILTYIYLQDY